MCGRKVKEAEFFSLIFANFVASTGGPGVPSCAGEPSAAAAADPADLHVVLLCQVHPCLRLAEHRPLLLLPARAAARVHHVRENRDLTEKGSHAKWQMEVRNLRSEVGAFGGFTATHPRAVFSGRAARNSAHGVLLLFRSVLPRGNSNGVSRALRRALRAKYTNRLMRVRAGAVLPDHLGFIARAASGRRLCGGRRSL